MALLEWSPSLELDLVRLQLAHELNGVYALVGGQSVMPLQKQIEAPKFLAGHDGEVEAA